MHPITFRCPGCGIALASATAFQPGKLVDCPKGRLLFTPFEEDAKIPRGRADELDDRVVLIEVDDLRPLSAGHLQPIGDRVRRDDAAGVQELGGGDDELPDRTAAEDGDRPRASDGPIFHRRNSRTRGPCLIGQTGRMSVSLRSRLPSGVSL